MRPIIYAFASGCFSMWVVLTENEARDAHVRALRAARTELSTLMAAPVATQIVPRKIVTVGAGRHGQFYLQGDLFGSVQMFLFDTGAADVGLRYDVATSVGLRWEDGREQCYSSANGKVCARTFLAPTLTIAGITKKDVTVAMFPQDALQGNIVGMSFLSKLSRFEVTKKSLVLVE